MKSKQSVYSKMYLVTPNVYDKVLQSIDEKLQKATSDLNMEKETEERPGEKILEDIAAQEIPTVTNVEPEVEVSANPEFIDPQNEQEAEPTFGQPEEITEPGEIVEPEMTQAVQSVNPEIQSVNPLTTSCAQPQVQDQFIPLIRKPNVKKTRVTAGKIKKTVIVPSILKRAPQIQRVQQEANMNPNIKMVKVSRPEPIDVIKDISVKAKKFVCNVCLKGFATNYHLNRHVNTVHKNLTSLDKPPQVQTNIQALPDDDVQMERPVFPKPSTSKQFQSWKDTQVQQVNKRKQADAKLKYTPRPPKTRPADDWFESWS